MKVGIVGLGYVGLTTGLVIASKGHEVIGIDIDDKKVKMLNAGRIPFYEPGLEELLRKALDSKLFIATTNYDAIRDAEIIFISVGTPSRDDGSIDLSFIESSSTMIGKALKGSSDYHLIVVKSTVTPGTTRNIVGRIIAKVSGKKLGDELGLCMNPEFLREGSALYDTLNPDKVIIGELDEKSGEKLYEFWYEFYRDDTEYLRTTLENAELIKYAINSFLATKISYINMLANICEKIPNCDIGVIARGMGLDKRINPAFFGAGLGFGGSCFPKDLRALIAFSKQSINYDPLILEATLKINEKQALHAIEIMKRELNDLHGREITILGLSYKPNTDDIREAVSIRIINELLRLGAKIRVYDPKAMKNIKRIYGDSLIYHNSAYDALDKSEAVIIVTEWNEFRKLKPKDFLRMKKPVVIDGRRILLDKLEEFRRLGIKYYTIGHYFEL